MHLLVYSQLVLFVVLCTHSGLAIALDGRCGLGNGCLISIFGGVMRNRLLILLVVVDLVVPEEGLPMC